MEEKLLVTNRIVRELKNKRNNRNLKIFSESFPAGSVIKNLPANAGDMGSTPELGRSHMSLSN